LFSYSFAVAFAPVLVLLVVAFLLVLVLPLLLLDPGRVSPAMAASPGVAVFRVRHLRTLVHERDVTASDGGKR
jgi:hypothetical protein